MARLQRQIQRKAARLGQAIQGALCDTLNKAAPLVAQTAQRKTADGPPKRYAWHAPQVECINKGKARCPHEFGVKVGIASTLKHSLIVAARAFHGNPYDGHTLQAQLEQATILMQGSGIKASIAYADLGYRGVEADIPEVRLVHRGKIKRLTAQQRRLLKRRQAIEPVIGHLKQDHRMDRCHLKGGEDATGCTRCSVCGGLQSPLTAAHDREEGRALFEARRLLAAARLIGRWLARPRPAVTGGFKPALLRLRRA